MRDGEGRRGNEDQSICLDLDWIIARVAVPPIQVASIFNMPGILSVVGPYDRRVK